MNGIMPDWLFIILVTAIGFPLTTFGMFAILWLVVKLINFFTRDKE